MRAAVLTAPHTMQVVGVLVPVARRGEALVAVRRVGLCGTEVEFFDGTTAHSPSTSRFPSPLIGLAGEPSLVDTRDLVLADVTAVGILSGSHGLDEAIGVYATGRVDPSPLVAATVALSGAGPVLAGERPAGAGDGPKVHIDPRLDDRSSR